MTGKMTMVVAAVTGIAGVPSGLRGSEPLSLLAHLAAVGDGEQRIDADVDLWENLQHYGEMEIDLECTYARQEGDLFWYDIQAKEGYVRFWGTAEYHDELFHETQILDFNSSHQFSPGGPGGRLAYSATDGRVVFVEFEFWAPSVEGVNLYAIQFFGGRFGHFARIWAEFPDGWWFDHDFDLSRYGLDFSDPSLPRNGLTGLNWDQVFYSDTQGGHGLFPTSGGWFQAEFEIPELYRSAWLSIEHLTSAAADCPGGGLSPIQIFVNGQKAQDCFDPARSHEGYHGFVRDLFDIRPFVVKGTNVLRIVYGGDCPPPCTHYWIRGLHLEFEDPRAASCCADLGYLWQSVAIPDHDDPAVLRRYDAYVIAGAIPAAPDLTVFPGCGGDPGLEPKLIVVREHGESCRAVTDTMSLRKILALCRSAALYRQWAAGGGDRFRLLDSIGGFVPVPVTPAQTWCGFLGLPGGTATDFGCPVPGVLWFPEEYEGVLGSSRLVDWRKLHLLEVPLAWVCVGDAVHPLGLANSEQRVKVYTNVLQHLVLQDGVKFLEGSFATEALRRLEVATKFLEDSSSDPGLAMEMGDLAMALSKVTYLQRMKAYVEKMKAKHWSSEKLLSRTRGYSSNNFTAYFKKKHPYALCTPEWFERTGKVFDSLSKVLVLAKAAQLPGEIIVLQEQVVTLQLHGLRILEALDLAFQDLDLLRTDPALKKALATIEEGLTDGVPLLVDETIKKLADGGTEVTLDLFQSALADGAAAAAATIEGAPLAVALIVLDLAIGQIREKAGYVADKLEREEVQQAVILLATLEKNWWDMVLRPQMAKATSEVPTEALLQRVGWLHSTGFYMAAFIAERLLEENSTFLSLVRQWFSEEYAGRRREQQAFAENLRLVMLGLSPDGAGPCAGDRFAITGRPYLDDHSGFNPPEAVDSLVGLAMGLGSDASILVFALGSPGDILVVDPAGRRAGTSHDRNLSIPVDLAEIPGANYSGREASPKTVRLLSPATGTYRVVLTGTGEGPFNLTVSSERGGVPDSTAAQAGTFGKGVVVDAEVSVIAAGAGLSAAFSLEPTARGSVAGRVVDSVTGQGILGAKVRVGEREVPTDDTGTFEIPSVPAGTVEVEATREGYRRFQGAPATLAPGARLVTDVPLVQNQPPVVVLADSFSGSPGIPVAFDASGSSDDGRIVLYEWDWDGNGIFAEFSASPLASHAWTEATEQMLSLRITDEEGLSASRFALVRIGGGPASFVRGDANADGKADISDAIAILGFLFLGSRMNDCKDAADVNDDGKVDISDSVRLLGFLFVGSERPPDPFGTCGGDPTADDLDCNTYSKCP